MKIRERISVIVILESEKQKIWITVMWSPPYIADSAAVCYRPFYLVWQSDDFLSFTLLKLNCFGAMNFDDA